MAKRELEDIDVSDIDSPVENVTVHGVVTSLSPVKVSKKWITKNTSMQILQTEKQP